MPVRLTEKQDQAIALFGQGATHCMLYGGSRSGKTFIAVRAIIIRAIAAPGSRHCILRFRFNHAKTTIIRDTLPKVLSLCFPDLKVKIDKTDWFVELPNKSQIWIGGLDDKERTEKILGAEYATIYLNEASQIPYSSRNMAITRLAQSCEYEIDGQKGVLRLLMLYDCNPPGKGHWTNQLFIQHRDPATKKPVDASDYCHLQMNPVDNKENLPANYLAILADLPPAQKVRFLEGMFGDDQAGQLWTNERIERNRHLKELPDMQRIAVAVDPSGSRDKDNAGNDAIGIVCVGLGVDGNAYVLEDATVKAGPATWGRVAAQCFDRNEGDVVVGEENFGGAMVEHVIQTAQVGRKYPYRKVSASRGKVVRAEPISALDEKNMIRFAGYFPDLEDELCNFTRAGYIGEGSPNRADAFIWAMTELFGAIVAPKKPKRDDNLPAFAPMDAGLGMMG